MNPLSDPRREMPLGSKILRLALQCLVLMAGVFAIWIMVYSREGRNKTVAEDIAHEWGETVYIDGPVAKSCGDNTLKVRPATFSCDASVVTKSLHRNIYEAEVFNATVDISGTFCKDSLASLSDTLFIEIHVETKQIGSLSPLKIGNQIIEWSRNDDCLTAEVILAGMPENIDYHTDFDVRGSHALYVMPIGGVSKITIDGEAPNPSFSGRTLPSSREVWSNRFSATWDGYGVADEMHNEGRFKFVGTQFLIGVDRYQKVARSLKYAFLIILLTYISALFTEVVMKQNIPLINYFLIGAALILFYSLLLSFVEHLSFGFSYLIASCMTIALISGYMWKMLSSRKVGIVMGIILTGLYVSCYILLSLTTYALLLGSLILFIALAAMMYGTLQVRS